MVALAAARGEPLHTMLPIDATAVWCIVFAGRCESSGMGDLWGHER